MIAHLLLLYLSSTAQSGDADPSVRMAPMFLGGDYQGRTQKTPGMEIEDSLFYLRAGDKLRLRWWGIGEGDERLVVDTRLNLLIPDVGIVPVAGRSLRDVSQKVNDLLKRTVSVRIMDLQLEELEPFRITVTGFVPAPGNHKVSPGTKVSQVLELAGLPYREILRDRSELENVTTSRRESRPSLRRIALVRAGSGDTTWCDLAMAYNAGITEMDPQVYPGDQIRILPEGRQVAVSGDVTYPGFWEVLPRESFSDLLRIAGRNDNTGSVSIEAGEGIRPVTDIKSAVGTEVRSILLPPKEIRLLQNVVWVEGIVGKPGGYGFEEGLLPSDYVRMAGGSLLGGDSSVTITVRRSWQRLKDGFGQGLETETQYNELRLASTEFRQRFNGGYSSLSVPIEPGDTVVVKRAPLVIWVGGQVRSPGFVRWKRNGTVEDYVELAGGYSGRPWRSRTTIFDLYSGQKVLERNPIRPGSVIIVPERRYITLEQWIQITATVISLTFAAMSIYLQVNQ